jgi:hypothetical protein
MSELDNLDPTHRISQRHWRTIICSSSGSLVGSELAVLNFCRLRGGSETLFCWETNSMSWSGSSRGEDSEEPLSDEVNDTCLLLGVAIPGEGEDEACESCLPPTGPGDPRGVCFIRGGMTSKVQLSAGDGCSQQTFTNRFGGLKTL